MPPEPALSEAEGAGVQGGVPLYFFLLFPLALCKGEGDTGGVG